MDKSTSYLFRRLLREYVRPYAGRLAVAVIFMAVAAACTAAMAKLMEPVLDDIFVAKDQSKLLWISGAILGVFVLKGVSTYFQDVLLSFVGQKIIADMQKQLYEHMMRADLAFFHKSSTGSLISRFTNDVNLLRSAVSRTITSLGKDTLTLVFLVAVMFYQDWVLATLSFFVFPVAILPIVKIGKKMRKVSTSTQEEMGSFTAHLDQGFENIRHIKAYQMETSESVRAHSLIDQLFSLLYRATKIKAVSKPIMETLGGLAIVIVVFYGGSQVIQDTRSTGTFFSFITALLLAYEPMKKLSNLNAILQEGLSAADRLFRLLDAPASIQDKNAAQNLTLEKGAIEFKDVTFSYEEDNAVEKISLKIPAGKTVALVGPSGAGKSTLLNLIPRFYDVDSGKIIIDGQNIQDITLESLRGSIGLVAQEVGLFDQSVAQNIEYGRPGASQEKIEEAAKQAAAHDFIMDLPDGYDTVIGERGVSLSGGQRQRLAIARAILKDAPILLLDEATSALDSKSEQHIQQALKHLTKGRTTLVIAHRLSTIMDADIIYVLKGGRLVEFGKHADLIDQDGIYAQLYQLQFAAQAA